MCKPTTGQSFQPTRHALLRNPVIPRVHVVSVSLAPNLLEIILEALRPQQLPNLTAKHSKLRRVHALRAVILFNQPRERCQRAIRLGLGKWRHEMVDDDGMRAPFRLRTLAGVVDNEWI